MQKSVGEFRWASDVDHECALLCFDTDLVEELLEGRELHEPANLKRFAYCVYHIAQCSKRRVAVRAKAANTKLMFETLVSTPSTQPGSS